MTTTIQQDLPRDCSAQAGDIGQQPDVDGPLGLGQAFLGALARRDFAGLEACFATEAVFRALVPSGVREGIGPQETVGWLRRWFGEADVFRMQRMEAAWVSDRLRISYSISLPKDGSLCLIEQQAYCTVANEKITAMNLLCSGFRPASLIAR